MIPASQLVTINPGVLSGGGQALALNGLILTQDTSIPIGTLQPFVSAPAAAAFFGASATESALAAVYFGGYDNATILPGELFFFQYNASAVAAYLRGASTGAMTLTQLQALNGTLIITVNGTQYTSSTINLSGASSFSNAASLIQAAFTTPPFTVSYDSQRSAFKFLSSTTGAASTIGFCTGTLSASLYLTQATGAVTSQGANATTPSAAMAAIVAANTNWANFMTTWEPVTADKVAFAQWTNAQNNRYGYALWETSAAATTYPDTTTATSQILTAGYSGTIPIYSDINHAAFVLGTAASIDFNRRNARITFAFKTQSGLNPSVTDPTIASNLKLNGFNFYGKYATATTSPNAFYPGIITGKYAFIDEYENEIYLNSAFQQAFLNLLLNVPSIPYNSDGFQLIYAAGLDPITAALKFGSIRPGVSLSASQVAQVNNAAGLQIDKTLSNQGWYLQILDPGAAARSTRSTPAMTFWYMDGGAVHQITMASITVQ